MSFPGASKIVIDNGPVVKVVISRARPMFSRAYVEDIPVGAVSLAVTWTTPLTSADYVPIAILANWVDNPALTPIISAQISTATPGASGFTVSFSAAIPTDNYKLMWAIAEKFKP